MDIAKLKAENQALRKKTQALEKENQALLRQMAQLKAQLLMLQQLIFSSKSERYVPKDPPSAEQLAFDFGELAPVDLETGQDLKEDKIKVTYERSKKNHPGRHPIPDHLPVEEIIIEPKQDTHGMQHIANTIVETLEYIPASLIRKRYIFPRYAQTIKDENGMERDLIIQGRMPSRPLPKSIAESGLLTQLIVSKFVYHLPFYRQIQQFKQLYNVELRKSTINSWFIAVCTLLKPLYQCLRQEVLQSNYIQADESPLKVQDKTKSGKTHKGYQWVYYAPEQNLVLFEYQKGRGQNGPKEVLKDFSGSLQTDGYAVYDKVVKNRKDITQVGCMAHARRYFFQARDTDPGAEKALSYFAQLYAIERELSRQQAKPDQIQQVRQQQSLPVLDQLFTWAKEQQPQALPKSLFGKALHYLLQRKAKLYRYCTDGTLTIDNNLVENSIRPLALGRKNYLFAGSHDAAQRIAMMYSFFATCKKQQINPVTWLKAVLDKIADHPINTIGELLPGKWCETDGE